MNLKSLSAILLTTSILFPPTFANTNFNKAFPPQTEEQKSDPLNPCDGYFAFDFSLETCLNSIKNNETTWLKLDPILNNVYSVSDIDQLADAIAQNESLVGLWLGDIQDGSPEFYQSLTKLIASAKNVKELYISLTQNRTETDILGLSQIIRSLADKQLETFAFYSNTDVSSQKEFNNDLAYFLKHNKTIKGLTIGYNMFLDASGKEFARALRLNKSLESLYFYETNFQDDDYNYSIDNLLRALKHHPLNSLTLEFFQYKDKGIVKLLNFVETSKMKSFNLHFSQTNFIFSPTIEAIAKVIANNTSLENFSIRDVFGSDDGYAEMLSDALRKNQTMKTVSFWANYFIEDDASILASSLEDNHIIVEFEGPWNDLTPEELALLESRLERNREGN